MAWMRGLKDTISNSSSMNLEYIKIHEIQLCKTFNRMSLNVTRGYSVNCGGICLFPRHKLES